MDSHDHNGINSKKLTGKALQQAPYTALTTATTTTINTGDAPSDAAITNMRTRINELEVALQKLQLLQ